MADSQALTSSATGEPGAGCWTHRLDPAEETCTDCERNACEHCYVNAPDGPLCIDCALRFVGVRVGRAP